MPNKLNTDRRQEFECPTCDSAQVRTEFVEHKFTYGVGNTAVDLTCQLPIRVCENCGGKFIDEAGEMVRQEAIYRYLNCLTPAKIHEIREQCGSQAAFSELTGIGEASLSRWETGASMPTKAYDNYLYLLTFAENIQRLRTRAPRFGPGGANPFRCIEINEARLSQQRFFSLRRKA